jgi:hypothetical protein
MSFSSVFKFFNLFCCKDNTFQRNSKTQQVKKIRKRLTTVAPRSESFLTFFLRMSGNLRNFANETNTKIEKIMVKHIILWTLNPELTEEQKQEVKAGIKAGLEGLVGKVPGLLDVKVHISGRLGSSNADVMLDSTLESPEALKGYAQHPEHVAVANTKVRPYTVQRSCLDFEI